MFVIVIIILETIEASVRFWVTFLKKFQNLEYLFFTGPIGIPVIRTAAVIRIRIAGIHRLFIYDATLGKPVNDCW